MALPTTSVLDSFTRADENPLANGTWAGPIIQGENPILLSSTVAKVSATANNNSRWSAATFGPDSEAYATIGGASSNEDWLVFVRIASPNSSTVTGYALLYRGSSTFLRIRRIDNGSFTSLGADVTISALADGDKIGLEVIGSTLTAYIKVGAGAWTSQFTRTDSTYSAAGYIGLGINDTGTNAATLDDFGGGTVAPQAAPTVPVTFAAHPKKPIRDYWARTGKA